jgi:hypothetical protein
MVLVVWADTAALHDSSTGRAMQRKRMTGFMTYEGLDGRAVSFVYAVRQVPVYGGRRLVPARWSDLPG